MSQEVLDSSPDGSEVREPPGEGVAVSWGPSGWLEALTRQSRSLSTARFVWLAAGLLLAISLLCRWWMVLGLGAKLPAGTDLEFWTYRALGLRAGDWHSPHPPGYPFLGLVLAEATGRSLVRSLGDISFIAGALAAPALMIACYPVTGRLGACFVGLMVATLPNLLMGGLYVEPSGLFVLSLTVVLWLARRLCVEGRACDAALLAVSLYWLGLVKEQGLAYFVVAGLPALLCVQGSRLRAVAAFLGALAAIQVGAWLLLPAGPQTLGLGSKALVSAGDTLSLLREGRLPVPLVVPVPLLPSRVHGWVDLLGASSTSWSMRLLLYAVIQSLRGLTFLGIWALLAPVAAFWALARARRAGWSDRQGLLLLVAPQLMNLTVLAVVVQPRHAEVAVLGSVLALGAMLDTWWRKGWKLPLLVVGGLGLAQAGCLMAIRDVPRFASLQQLAREDRELAFWAVSHVPAGARLCSSAMWVGAWAGTTVTACRPALRRPEDWWFGPRDDLLGPHQPQSLRTGRMAWTLDSRWRGPMVLIGPPGRESLARETAIVPRPVEAIPIPPPPRTWQHSRPDPRSSSGTFMAPMGRPARSFFPGNAPL